MLGGPGMSIMIFVRKLPVASKIPERSAQARKGALYVTPLLLGTGLFVVLLVAFGFVANMALRTDFPGIPGEFDASWAFRMKRVGDHHPENTPWIKAVTHLGDKAVLALVALLGVGWQLWRGGAGWRWPGYSSPSRGLF